MAFKLNDKLFFWLITGLVITDRLILLILFGFRYVDSDVLVQWLGAKDYSQFIFHEPFFYGQDYNPMLEAWVAVPFVWLNVPFNISLPLVTSFLTLFPFLFFGYRLFQRGETLSAAIITLIPLLLPVQYGILTSISRGFVSGVFFCAFLLPILTGTKERVSFPVFGICSALAIYFNPNSVVFLLPAGIYMLLRYYRKPSFYIHLIIWPAFALTLQQWAKNFYVRNPDYRIHSMTASDYAFGNVSSSLKELDVFFSHLSPLVWPAGWISLPLLLIAGIILLRKHRSAEGTALITGVIAIVLMLGFRKVHDHNPETLLLSSSRMFLALPLLFTLGVYWIMREFRLKINTKYLFIAATTVLIIKAFFYQPLIAREVRKEDYGNIAITSVSDLCHQCDSLKEVARIHQTGLFVFAGGERISSARMSMPAYACPLLIPDFPETLLAIGDKRTWVYQRIKPAIYSNLIFYGDFHPFADDKDNVSIFTAPGKPNTFVVRNNDQPTKELSKELNVGFKRCAYFE